MIAVEFSLRFINHKEQSESIRKEFKTTFPIKGGQGWGDRKAFKAAKINEDAGFLKSDTLHLEASIVLKKILWSI